MDDQLKQSALDFHEFPVPGKSGFSNEASGNTARFGAGLTLRCLAWHLVLKSKKTR